MVDNRSLISFPAVQNTISPNEHWRGLMHTSAVRHWWAPDSQNQTEICLIFSVNGEACLAVCYCIHGLLIAQETKTNVVRFKLCSSLNISWQTFKNAAVFPHQCPSTSAYENFRPLGELWWVIKFQGCLNPRLLCSAFCSRLRKDIWKKLIQSDSFMRNPIHL